MKLLLALLICSLALMAAAETASGTTLEQARATEPARPLPSRDATASLQGLRVVVMNDISAHFEVLAGVLHMLRKAGIQPTTLYTGTDMQPFNTGLLSWLGVSASEIDAAVASPFVSPGASNFHFTIPSLGTFHAVGTGRKVTLPEGLAADLVICMSPELALGECEHVLRTLRPSHFTMFVHRGDSITFKLRSLYPRQNLVALSPHVAELCTNYTKIPTTWTLPIAPYKGLPQCQSLACLDGFILQGAVRSWTTKSKQGFTRDYARLWCRLQELRDQASEGAPRVKVIVMGRGETSKLGVPAALQDDVEHLSGLPYPEFWGRMHRSLALLPCFGSEAYYRSRLSSTIVASIITGTPLIASRRLLSAYRFLSEEHVFLQHEGEDDAAAMHRILTLPESDILARRQALVRLRAQLNSRTSKLLAMWFEQATLGPPEDVDGADASIRVEEGGEAESTLIKSFATPALFVAEDYDDDALTHSDTEEAQGQAPVGSEVVQGQQQQQGGGAGPDISAAGTATTTNFMFSAMKQQAGSTTTTASVAGAATGTSSAMRSSSVSATTTMKYSQSLLVTYQEQQMRRARHHHHHQHQQQQHSRVIQAHSKHKT